jgi:hypothetical protein
VLCCLTESVWPSYLLVNDTVNIDE